MFFVFSNNELKITLWGDHAVNFTVGDLNTRDNPKAVIGLFVGFIPRKWHSHSSEQKPYLSGSSSSYHYLNPDITEALPFYNRCVVHSIIYLSVAFFKECFSYIMDPMVRWFIFSKCAGSEMKPYT